MSEPKLFMVMIGCKPPGRHTEQHDIFFGIAENMTQIVPQLKLFWPEAASSMHVDAWREVTHVDGHAIQVVRRSSNAGNSGDHRLFFINLGGYKPGEFDEFHYKVLAVGASKNDAIRKAKQTAFFQHTGFPEAPSHIDDRYGIDVDDLYEISEVLLAEQKAHYHIRVTPAYDPELEDAMHLGYFPLKEL